MKRRSAPARTKKDRDRQAAVAARTSKARIDYVGYCGSCGKYGYATAALARKAHKQHFPGAHLSTYPCPATADAASSLFHFGHLPKEVIAGKTVTWWTRGYGAHTRKEPA